MRSSSRGWRTTLLAALALIMASAPHQLLAEDGSAAGAVLRRAFDNRYGVDTRFSIELVVRNDAGEALRRSLVVATKRIDGRLHSLGRFTYPPDLRGTTVLNIERGDRSDDHFLYLRSLGRIRRVGTSQRSDSFMGTDLTYEDFDRRRAKDYRVVSARTERLAGEEVRVVTALPRLEAGYGLEAGYDRAEFWIAVADEVILETRTFKHGSAEPIRVVRTPRAGIVRLGGHDLPTRMHVENPARGTRTDVRIEDLVVDPDLDDALFTSAAIEVGRPIPGLE